MPEFVLAHGHVVYQPKARRAVMATHAELECAIDDTLCRWLDISVLEDHRLLHLEKV
jgi:hypothetical protein